MYLIRLDDASEYSDTEKWNRIEQLLDKYNIKPIIGIIPKNEDRELTSKYPKSDLFWNKVEIWKNKGWEIALHGYNHVYSKENKGINPVNNRSEFSGETLEKQRRKIRKGIKIFSQHDIQPKIFFAPSHTFDENTIEAIKKESNIKVISDTIANDSYKYKDLYFIPQQSGKVRKLPFKIVTFCYHPNIMNDSDFNELERFIKKYRNKFIEFDKIKFKERKKGIYDKILEKIYFYNRRNK